jgi:hypothetical protein
MALWQIIFDPIPAASAQVGGMAAIRLTREQLDAITLPVALDEQERLFEELGHLLPEKSGWADDMRIWGDEKSHDVQVYFDAGEIECLQVRIDVTTPSIALVSGLCELAHSRRWVFATRDGKIVQPSTEAVIRAILQSDASRFVADPEAFLEAALQADAEKA